MRNKCSRIKQEDYENSGANPFRCFIPDFDSNLPFKDFQRVHKLYQNNVNNFRMLWGRQSCCWSHWNRFWIWKHEFENCNIYVLVNPKNFGTAYEVQQTGNLELLKEEVKTFLEDTLVGIISVENDNENC